MLTGLGLVAAAGTGWAGTGAAVAEPVMRETASVMFFGTPTAPAILVPILDAVFKAPEVIPKVGVPLGEGDTLFGTPDAVDAATGSVTAAVGVVVAVVTAAAAGAVAELTATGVLPTRRR
jgi:hypothetical protein